MVPSSTYQLRIESIASSTARMKQADACCGTPFTPMLNHTGELNAAFWWTMRCFSSSRKVAASVVVDEVAVLHAPLGDRVDDPVDDLAQRRLALGRPERPAEVLLGEDVRRVHAPGGGHLDAELLEGDRAGPVVGDARVAPLPGDLVVGMRTLAVKCRRIPMSIRSPATAIIPPRTRRDPRPGEPPRAGQASGATAASRLD